MLLDWWERYRRLILIVAAIAFLALSFWLYQRDNREGTVGVPIAASAYAQGAAEPKAPSVATAPAEQRAAPDTSVPASASASRQLAAGAAQEQAAPSLYVDVKGKVKKPGLYRFAPGKRVADAIEEAGGALPQADLDQINLAQPLADGTALIIPAKGSSGTSPLPGVGLPSPASVQVGGNGALGAGSSKQPGKTVNLNSATVHELMTLPGIGESRAAAILEYRTQVGRFRSVDELKKVSGIGAKMFEKIKDHIVAQ
ncbi:MULTISPECIES: helix-hairpin-helix domain-containing protein [Brevibacillus]|uniref:helix-hairpin-helix domain-containing protein n=1 Tax=Brevibacillus TaxID=55080 RepID=UPI000ED3E78A|nr:MULTISPECIES: helix-hairpin-helix domain-containing protein [Brevibacillus]MDH6352926.1 competence protein ComEA [Brevibacillus sp. 1238]WDV97242.1 helix-hairpin-helix domain-containing protein [Brevibacillus parabrevis]HBZ82441.1 competence protein ComEA [Brevibacillus sp.]